MKKATSFKEQVSQLSNKNLLELTSCGGFTEQEAIILATLLEERYPTPDHI